MNNTGIEWTDFTWNPVTGCYHGCEYCYARRIAHRFRAQHRDDLLNELASDEFTAVQTDQPEMPFPYEFRPTFHKYRLDQPKQRQKEAKIFVGSMGDLFGDWVPEKWVESVLDIARECPQHTFQFLTKNPERYLDFDFPDNCWLGTSVDGRDFKTDHERTKIMEHVDATVRFLSVEPILGNVESNISFAHFNWVIIGAQTGPDAKAPKDWWIQAIMKNYRGPIFLKDNLNWLEKIQEWPKTGDDDHERLD